METAGKLVKIEHPWPAHEGIDTPRQPAGRHGATHALAPQDREPRGALAALVERGVYKYRQQNDGLECETTRTSRARGRDRLPCGVNGERRPPRLGCQRMEPSQSSTSVRGVVPLSMHATTITGKECNTDEKTSSLHSIKMASPRE